MIGMIIGWAIGGAIIIGAMEIVSRISDAIELRKIKQGQKHNAISILPLPPEPIKIKDPQ
jgi:hypothetical protein